MVTIVLFTYFNHTFACLTGHRPGKAGGGWGDDDDDEETEQQQQQQQLSVSTSTASVSGTGSSDRSGRSGSELTERLYTMCFNISFTQENWFMFKNLN